MDRNTQLFFAASSIPVLFWYLSNDPASFAKVTIGVWAAFGIWLFRRRIREYLRVDEWRF